MVTNTLANCRVFWTKLMGSSQLCESLNPVTLHVLHVTNWFSVQSGVRPMRDSGWLPVYYGYEFHRYWPHVHQCMNALGPWRILLTFSGLLSRNYSTWLPSRDLRILAIQSQQLCIPGRQWFKCFAIHNIPIAGLEYIWWLRITCNAIG